ncbi:hypothetical protein MTR67_040284 [Solanum verrucosum]|jgi:hypothetical protein
MGKT